MRVLVLAPHPDDESIGCGGVLALHVATGDRVVVVFLTSGELSIRGKPKEEVWAIREAEARRAAGVLGIERLKFLRQPDWLMGNDVSTVAELVRPILARERPDRIYAPHEGDDHPDHRAALAVLRRAAPSFAGEIRAFEVWTPLPSADVLEDVTTVMQRKLRAIRCYSSQLADRRYDRAAAGLNRYRAAMNKTGLFAEAFQRVARKGADGS